jgi:ABC-2 type transport system permease protein
MTPRLLLTIAGRETRALAESSVAHVAAALALAVSGLFFTAELSSLTQARLDGWFDGISVVVLFLAPVLAMRSLAEERRSGSLDVLLAGPVTDGAVVVGKFLGLASVYLGILLLSFAGPALVLLWGDPDPGPLFSGYLALALLGVSSLAVALLASALSPHQAVAAVVGFVLLLALWLLEGLSASFAGSVSDVIARLGSTTYLPPFYRGLLRLDGIVYFASVTVVGLLAATRVVEARRWR